MELLGISLGLGSEKVTETKRHHELSKLGNLREMEEGGSLHRTSMSSEAGLRVSLPFNLEGSR